MADNEHEDLVDYDDEEVSDLKDVATRMKEYIYFQRTLNIRLVSCFRDEPKVEFDDSDTCEIQENAWKFHCLYSRFLAFYCTNRLMSR